MDTYNNFIDMNRRLSSLNKKSELPLTHMSYKELLLKKRKEKIKADIFNLINKKMESIERKMENNSNSEISYNNSKSLNRDKFQDYNGEKVSVIQTLEQDNSNNNDSSNYNLKNKKKIGNNYINLKKYKISDINKKDFSLESISETKTIINNSYFGYTCDSLEIEKIDKNKNIFKKKNNIATDNFIKNKIRNILIPKTPQKNNNNDNNNTNGKIFFKDIKKNQLYDSTSTCNTDPKNKNKSKYSHYNNDLNLFFTEINLPSIYADKLIENGFDDLSIILDLTKTNITITNKNLKDIGIKKAGHRAQILIHLEERAGIFPFYVEKKIIYNNCECNNNENNYCLYNDKLFTFLSRIGCEFYLNNFKRNGYCNIKLLLTQMFTREPIDKKMLKEDFCIDNENDINTIINNLLIESKKYIKGLKKTYKLESVVIENNIYRNSCEPCLIF